MNLKSLKYFFFLMMAVITLSSCSEDDATTDEYANWQERNDKAFADTLEYAKAQIAAGSTEWKVIPNYSLANQKPTNMGFNGSQVVLKYKDTDYIVVHVLNKGNGNGSPLYTDSIQVSYRGRLIPTDSYATGYVFDQSFTGTYDETTALPVKAKTNKASSQSSAGWIDGFTTALMAMHPGDHWQVFMPADLAYGSSGNGSVPGYSMLRFEMVLKSYKRASGKKWITEQKIKEKVCAYV